MTGRYWNDLLTEDDSEFDNVQADRQNYGFVDCYWSMFNTLFVFCFKE